MRANTAQERFAALYSKEADAIFRFCFLRTSDREVALDLTQETFMRFWNVSQKGTVVYERALLFTIARNLIIDWYRKGKSISLDALAEEEVPEADPPAAKTERADLETGTEARLLLEKIKELNPAYRQVIFLRFVEDLRPKDIAAMLGDSVGSVSVRINRGLKQLRKIAGYDAPNGKPNQRHGHGKKYNEQE